MVVDIFQGILYTYLVRTINLYRGVPAWSVTYEIRGSKGFDRGLAAGEAIRMQCVKWQN